MSVPGQWRTARKPKRCDHCKKEIQLRERYFEYLGETPAYQTGDPFCTACAASQWGEHDSERRGGESGPKEE